ncbi:MAG: tRNA (5-methylaminomethyl-2-thiouridine)(34)-methyltransferase MnmD [Flavobacteriaceae bacterium]|nr:tRNA (5-methylaminomethyl-2-thiouridine)(34)-methyltransferase MnmD [Flavobacteriaceae bacterium]
MKREIFITADGSTSINLPDWNEQYHSKHGAVQEAYHVFIKYGLDAFVNGDKVNLLEIGFGTALNCFITFLESEKRNLKIDYDGIEAYPVTYEESKQLNYVDILQVQKYKETFDTIHKISWGERHTISTHFNLKKRKQLFENITDKNKFDLIYFDAFGSRVQPELWTETIFQKMYDALKPNGILVTYAAKGSARRAMQKIGFEVKKVPGPLCKREMMRAVKI